MPQNDRFVPLHERFENKAAIYPRTLHHAYMTSRTRNWALALLGAMLYTAAQATLLTQRVPKVPWLELYLFELPVWLAVLAISPLVFWLARRIPLYGEKSTLNFFVHLVTGCVVLFLQFLLVESMRRFIVAPVVVGAGLTSTEPALAYAGITDRSPLFIQAAIAFKYYSLLFLFVYFALAILYYAYTYHRQLHAAQVRAHELQTLLAKSQLDSLRLQLHPHFLFNTLNTVSSLMSRDIVLARRMLARLSELLRETLSETAVHEVSLGSELRFLDAYLEIQESRFGSRLRIDRQVEPFTLNLLVPRMLLQPLVENCIHHGMRDGNQPLCIHIKAAAAGGSLQLSVSDDGAGAGNGTIKERVGLRNTRERLERLYGRDQRMEIDTPASGGFSVRLVMPAHQAKQESTEDRTHREIA